MRLTYSNILAQHLRNINLVGSTDANILADFNYNLGQRYQLILATLADFVTTQEYGFSVGMQTTLLSSGVAKTISGITSSSTTATVTTSGAHGYSTSNVVEITGASPSGYNGKYTITVTSTTTFTYTLSAALTSPATVSQYYPYPQGEVQIEGMYITIGSVNYPLQCITSRFDWEQLNAIQIQASAIPQFYFPRRDDFGIWPTPQTVYTGNMSYRYRDRNLSVADYTGPGTIVLTQGSATVVGTSTSFTPAMVGRWLVVTDPTIPGQGYWNRVVGYTSATVIQLYQPWTAATTSAISLYTIGETPEIPEEGHTILAAGTTADYYGGMQKDPDNYTMFDNIFWTGNPKNGKRTMGDKELTGGLLGLRDKYVDRDDRHLIKRKPRLNPLQYKVWATSLS